MATTTTIVSGLVAIELYKIINSSEYKIEDFKNTFIGLGVCFIGSSEPVISKSNKVGNLDINLWTKLKYNNMSIQNLINNLKKNYNLIVDLILDGNRSIYTSYEDNNKMNEILEKDIKTLINKNKIVLNVSISDEFDNSDIILVEIE